MDSVVLRDARIAFDQKGTGQPVAFLNGVMMTTSSWAFQVHDLAERYRCILHDCRGQLMSEKTGGYTMDGHAEDFRALLDHLDIERCHVVGTSYGGEIGMIFAARYPDRVASLSVIASAGHVEPALEQQIRAWMKAAENPTTLFQTMFSDNYSAEFMTRGAGLLAAAEARIRSFPPDFFRAFQELCGAFLELDIRDRLAAIQAPTLIMVGEKDQLKTPAYSAHLAARIPNACSVVIPGAGHAVVIEQPDAVNAELEAFLREHEERI